MCEILFRGKQKGDGEWVEGYFCGKVNKTFFAPAKDSTQIIDANLYWHEVIPETVGQYTGLTDKNGTKIFEGDIVKIFLKDGVEIGPIKWSDIGCRYKFASPDGTAYAIDVTDIFEVIGNIHDNPELLKECNR